MGAALFAPRPKSSTHRQDETSRIPYILVYEVFSSRVRCNAVSQCVIVTRHDSYYGILFEMEARCWSGQRGIFRSTIHCVRHAKARVVAQRIDKSCLGAQTRKIG